MFHCRVHTNFIDPGHYEEKGLTGIEFADNPVQATSTKKKKKSKAVETSQREWLIKQGIIVPEEEVYDPCYEQADYEQADYEQAGYNSTYTNVFFSEYASPTPSSTPPPYGPYSPPPSSAESILQYEGPDNKLDFYRSEKEYVRPSTFSDHNWISQKSRVRSRWDSQSPDRRQRKHHYSSSSASSMDHHERAYRKGDSSHQSDVSRLSRYSYDSSSGRQLSYSAEKKESVSSDLPRRSSEGKLGSGTCKIKQEKALSEGEVEEDSSNEDDENHRTFSVGNCLAMLRGEVPEPKKKKNIKEDNLKVKTDGDGGSSKRDVDDTNRSKDPSRRVRSGRASVDDEDDDHDDDHRSRSSKKKRKMSRSSSSEKRRHRERSEEKRSSRKKKHKRKRSSSSDYERESRENSRSRGREKKHKERKGSKEHETKEKHSPEKTLVEEEACEVRKRKSEASDELPLSKKVAAADSEQDTAQNPPKSNSEPPPGTITTTCSPSHTKDPVVTTTSSPKVLPNSSTPVPIMIPFYLPYPPEYIMNQMTLTGQCPVIQGAAQWPFQNAENPRSRSGTPVMDEPPADPKGSSTNSTSQASATPASSPKSPPAQTHTSTSALPTTVPSTFPGYIIPTPFFTGSGGSQPMTSSHLPMMMTLPGNPYLPSSTVTSETVTRPISSIQLSPHVPGQQLPSPATPERDNIRLATETSKQVTEDDETVSNQRNNMLTTKTEAAIPITTTTTTAMDTSSKLADNVIKSHEDLPEPDFDVVRSSTPVSSPSQLTSSPPRRYTEMGTQTTVDQEEESDKQEEEDSIVGMMDDMDEPPSPLRNAVTIAHMK